MVQFQDKAALAAFLDKLDPGYAQHPPALWLQHVRSPRQFVYATKRMLLSAGLPEPQIADIKARAGSTGESLAYTTLPLSILVVHTGCFAFMTHGFLESEERPISMSCC